MYVSTHRASVCMKTIRQCVCVCACVRVQACAPLRTALTCHLTLLGVTAADTDCSLQAAPMFLKTVFPSSPMLVTGLYNELPLLPQVTSPLG